VEYHRRSQYDYARGTGAGTFAVKNSTSEILVNKYGFWLDAPTLKGIVLLSRNKVMREMA
jgi:hypothetical protein